MLLNHENIRAQGAVDLVVVIGYYAMLNAVLASLGVELEPHLAPALPV